MGDLSRVWIVKGTVVLMKNNIEDFLGRSVSLQLVSASVADPDNGNKGVVGEAAYLEAYRPEEKSPASDDPGYSEVTYSVTFKWEVRHGLPGAVIVKNLRVPQSEFYLKTFTLDDFPSGRIHFLCHSWVYHVSKYSYDRIFFTNTTYLPRHTPVPLRPYIEEELLHLRGDDVTRKLEPWDRVYNYAYYNDLGIPPNLTRPVLGGPGNLPYPRRGRTNRPPTPEDPKWESRAPPGEDIYVPRDEQFSFLKRGRFPSRAIAALNRMLLQSPPPDATLRADQEWTSFDQMINELYFEGVELPPIDPATPLTADDDEALDDLITINGAGMRTVKLPMPQVIRADRRAWMTDEEFARQMLAGVNPVIIRRLQTLAEFPPASKLDPKEYGNQNSSITAAHIEKHLDGLTVEQALQRNRLFILDHHDDIMPLLPLILTETPNRVYATRTLLFLRDTDSTLKPVAIELSLPHPKGPQHGAVSRVFTPPPPAETTRSMGGSLWGLAKAYVCVSDTGIHQLISHWLNTHATMEPFVIATSRHLSVVHPIYKLLKPHYKDTMGINAIGRQILANAGGAIEGTQFTAQFSMQASAEIYKNWKLTDLALPTDLLKRGVAVPDPNGTSNIRLLIEDYPYAVDGLFTWSAIETWVDEYCDIYYPDDTEVRADAELQAWWREAREEGHGDKKDEAWWPKMETLLELKQTCATLIWVAAALHAAVNFGQYPYGGFNPNRPTLTRRFMPEEGSAEYEELRADYEKFFLRTITGKLQTINAISVMSTLSAHDSEALYLGLRDAPEWTTDAKALGALERFDQKLEKIEAKIREMNRDHRLKNRNGLVQMPYTLFLRSSPPGITMKGIPNSVSI